MGINPDQPLVFRSYQPFPPSSAQSRKGELEERVAGFSKEQFRKRGTEEEFPHPKRSVTVDPVVENIMACFDIKQEEALFMGLLERDVNIEALASMAYQLSSRRLRQVSPITTEEILAIHTLLFGERLQNLSIPHLQGVNPYDPHPAFVFRELYSCLERLQDSSSFQEAVEKREGYFAQFPDLVDLLLFSEEERKETLELLRRDNPRAAHRVEEALSKCPVYTAKDLFGSSNINEVYVLQNKKGKSLGIFKPVMDEEVNKAKREHTAYLLNLYHAFPIPATFYVNIKGTAGSLQLFIDGAKAFCSLSAQERRRVSISDLQKLFIFDTLFSNCDRNEANVLFKKHQNQLSLIGIDHDECMKGFCNKPLAIEYLKFSHASSHPFNPEMNHLVSQEARADYTRIMLEQGMPQEAVDWMNEIGEFLEEGISQARSPGEIWPTIKALWDHKSTGDERALVEQVF